MQEFWYNSLLLSLCRGGRRPSDLYEKSFTRFRNTRRTKAESSDDIPLQSKSDLAYETMYDDDEIVDTAQTMPWFDPKYLASGRDEVGKHTVNSLIFAIWSL